jgi:hypothetical protein
MAKKKTPTKPKRKKAPKKSLASFFGTHAIPFSCDAGGFSLTRKEGALVYRRGDAEKLLLTDAKEVTLWPVEPVNEPGRAATRLFLEFGTPVSVEPHAQKTLYLTFPVEVGVFVLLGKEAELVDIVASAQPKLTLYGNPGDGVICKYFPSQVYAAEPAPDPDREGVLKLDVHNTSSQWAHIGRAVFQADGMKVFFDHETVSMSAQMKVLNPKTAETAFVDEPIRPGMERARELYKPAALSVTRPTFVMMEGL